MRLVKSSALAIIVNSSDFGRFSKNIGVPGSGWKQAATEALQSAPVVPKARNRELDVA